ncbi:hypothetical protein C8Q77DRAFT_1057157 [Trametes polyzona]|nr:hypothetical protein C8Q77DRAFT_1057157 [Trametes polyzona]
MSTFTLTVNVASADLIALKQAGYNLCIAKKVNNTYNTVWRGGRPVRFLARNTFQWTSSYQVFGTQTFSDGALVVAATETPQIQFGQTALLDTDGSMHNPTGSPDTSGTFSVDNEYAAMNIGVNGYLSGAFSPIFVTPDALVTGNVSLTPVETILVWFDSQHVTSTIIATSVSNTIEVDYTGGFSSRSVTYASAPGQPGTGAWTLDGQLRLASTYNPTTNLFAVQRPSAGLLAKIGQLLNAASTNPSGVPTGLGASPTDNTAFTATITFDDANTVNSFAAYAQSARPHGLSTWDVSAQGSAVVVQLAISEEDAQPDLQDATRKIPYKFLSILHGWTGAQYKTLTFAVPGAHGAYRV